MKLALTVWQGRISPLFDCAHMLLIADIENRIIREMHLVPLDCTSASSRAEKLNHLGVKVLICNGISSIFANLIEAHRIEIVPFAAGAVDKVLEAYLNGNLYKNGPDAGTAGRLRKEKPKHRRKSI